jgi:deoxyribodipyrimidine photolyase-related protein
MAKPLYFVGPWDLHRSLPCVPQRPEDGTVLLVRSKAKGRALPYHRQKLVMVLSAMAHFAEELEGDGFDVSFVDAPSYVDGIREQVQRSGADRVHAMRPREWGLNRALEQAATDEALGAALTLHDDGGAAGHFLLERDAFATWATGRKQIRMQHFYSFMRKRSGWLMDGNKPLGGKWSFDTSNRKHARGVPAPPLPRYEPDALTRSLIEEVNRWPGHWGDASSFDWPVTRAQALAELDDFFAARAAGFGPYQDAMIHGQPFLWHTRLAAAMNLSLISPREVCERICLAHERGQMGLASAEGLLRQILGWREFIRGIYWLKMPSLRDANQLGARRRLPKFYWEPEATAMRCVSDCVSAVERHGYANHIQRLMVLGNFALLAGIAPLDVSHWFWAGFVDAYEWVELPNVHGMALFADDTFTTKPYAASGSYIAKMSDYCTGCAFNPKMRVGEQACPFNALFWAFMNRHRARFEVNPRMRMLYRTWDRFDEAERRAIVDAATRIVESLPEADHRWRFDDDGC